MPASNPARTLNQISASVGIPFDSHRAETALVGTVDHYGTLTEYRYDADDRRVATVTYENKLTAAQMTGLGDPTSAKDIASLRPTAYMTDRWSWTVYDADSRVIQTIDGEGGVATYQYDAADRLVGTKTFAAKMTSAQVNGYKTTAPTSVVTPTSDAAHDSVSRTFYDKDGLVIGSLNGEGYLSRIDYDKAGRKVATTQFATVNGDVNRATDTFPILLNNQSTSTNDRTSRMVYDDQGLPRYTVDPLNHVVEYIYTGGVTGDATGVARTTIAYASAVTLPSTFTCATMVSALSSQQADANNRKSWAVYDAVGRLSYTIDAAGGVTHTVYDAYGRVANAVAYATARATTSLPTLSDMNSWASSYASSSADRTVRSFYTAANQLRYTVDPEGYVTRFDYDAEGRQAATIRWDAAVVVSDTTTITQLATMVTGSSVTTSTSYDMDGRVATTTDGAGIVTAYQYRGNGMLATVTKAYGTSAAVTTGYGYDLSDRLRYIYDAFGDPLQLTRATKLYDGLGNLTSETDANGNTTTFAYDHAGRLLTSTNALAGITSYQYDAFGAVVKTTDVRNNASYSYYDNLGRVIATRDAEDYVTESSYTIFGELNSVTRRANRASNTAAVGTLPTYVADAKDATTSFGYDRLGRATSTSDALGYAESTTFDALGNKLTTTSKLGAVTNYTYNRRGLLTSEVLPISSVTAAGTVQAASVINTYGYDARGNRVSMTEAAGLAEARTTTWVYDKLDRVTETHLPAVLNASGNGTVSPVEYTRYDARDNVIEQDDAAGARTLFFYDKLDRQIASISPLGTYSTISYTLGAGINGGTQTSRTYSTQVSLPGTPGGTPPAAPSGEYRETVATFDKLGRMVQSSVTNALVGAWNGSTYNLVPNGTLNSSWQYDASGNVIKESKPSTASSYTYYDKLGRKTAGIDAGGYLTTWTLNADGNVLSERRFATATTGATTAAPPSLSTSTNDRVTDFVYNKMGRRTTEFRRLVGGWAIDSTSTGTLIAYAPGSPSSDSIVGYTYNAAGEVLTKHEAAGDTTTYHYDSAGRLDVESRASYLDQTGTTVTPTVRYSYDGLGNLTRTQQGGATASGSDRTTSYTYGAGGRLASMTDPTGAVHGYYYDIVGRKVGEAYDRVKSDASVAHEGIAYQYDLAGQLIRQNFATVSGGTFTIAGDTITLLSYNAFGELTSRSLQGTGSDTTVRVQEQNRYDNVGHLWASDAADGVWRYYVYDANGNRTLMLEDEGKAGVNLRDQSLATLTAFATNNGANTVGSTYIDGINATIYQYDNRDMVTWSAQMQRQLNDAGAAVNIVSSQTYNAFGETLSQTDALGHVTNYTYNAMGRVLTTQHAAVTVGNEDGTTTANVTPTDTFYYDLSGRLIGQRDANNNLTSRLLIAGTGYGQSEALVAKEYHPDGGVKVNGYDVYGDLRDAADELARHTTNLYDGLGRLTQVTHPAGAAGALIDAYSYDVLGQRVAHSNNFAYEGYNYKETSDYDIQGRIISQRALAAANSSGVSTGDLTTNSYVWSSSLATAGLDSFGGWTQTTTFANAKTIVEASDGFDHVISHTDMGGHASTQSYDTAGRVVERAGTETQRYSYDNTGLVSQVSAGINYGSSFYETAHSTYGYDQLGEKLTEYATSNGSVIENATASYDALGRMATWNEAGSALTPAATKNWSYDAVGNIRSNSETYHMLAADGTLLYNSFNFQGSNRYRYDAMNRVVASGDTSITYDAAGERTSATTLVSRTVTIANPNYDDSQLPKNGNTPNMQTTIYLQSLDRYFYNADGTLSSVYSADGSYTDNGNGTVTTTAPTASPGNLKSTFSYDMMGRMTRQQDWTGNGTGIAYDRQLTFDSKGRISAETDIQLQGSDTYTNYVSNDYHDGQYDYALGAVLYSTAAGYKNGTYQQSSGTTTGYAWYDGAVQSTISYKPNTGQSTTYTTTYGYSGSGTLVSANVQDGRPRTVAIINNVLGQAVKRDESDNNNSQGDPHQISYFFEGKTIGTLSNNGSTSSTGFETSQQMRAAPTGTTAFANGTIYGESVADFDQSYDAINSFQQGSSGGTYTVRGGDTLSTVAAQLWGDASLWYKLAQANGLIADGALTEGQTLIVPAGVNRTGNSSSTFRPYDVSDAYGDTSPTTPKPQSAKKNKCGVFGAILIAVVAVAVTIASSGAALAAYAGTSLGTGIGTVLGTATIAGVGAGTIAAAGVVGAVVGSVVSQGFGIAIGAQSKFDWKGVAISALTAGVTAGIGPGGILGKSGLFGASQVAANGARTVVGGLVGKVGNAALRAGLNGIVSNAVVQGLEVVSGLEEKFDWAGVAAAGVGAGVGTTIKTPGFGGKVLRGFATDIADAATRSLADGSDFGGNVLAALPGTAGSLIGELVMEAVQSDSTAPKSGISESDTDATGQSSGLNSVALDSQSAFYGALLTNPLDVPSEYREILAGPPELGLPSQQDVARWLSQQGQISVDPQTGLRILQLAKSVSRAGALGFLFTPQATGAVSQSQYLEQGVSFHSRVRCMFLAKYSISLTLMGTGLGLSYRLV